MGCGKCRAHMCDDNSPHKPVTSTKWLYIIRLGLCHYGGAFRCQNLRFDETPMCKHTLSLMQVSHRTFATRNVPICNWSGSNRCDRGCRYRARALAPSGWAWCTFKLEIKGSLGFWFLCSPLLSPTLSTQTVRRYSCKLSVPHAMLRKNVGNTTLEIVGRRHGLEVSLFTYH